MATRLPFALGLFLACGCGGGEFIAGAPEIDAALDRAVSADASLDQEAQGGDAGADASDASPCDPASTPSTSSCVVSDAYGVFVSPVGSDSNAGTEAQPVATIGKGIDVAKAAGKRVYVCAHSYPESLVEGPSRDGVRVYGGMDCATWSYGTANKVVVAPAQTGYALELDNLASGVTFEDVEFDAQDGNPSHPGESSVAVFANGAQHVTLRRVTLVAGKGADGAAGASGGSAGDPSNQYAGSLDGLTAPDAGGAPQNQCVCPADHSASTGGRGGSAGMMGTAVPPGAGLPSYGVAGAGSAGTNASACNGGSGGGLTGADAPLPMADTPSTSLGALTASGWAPATGIVGSYGKPGQGGGGGGNGPAHTGGGGGGACGGCGGAGGKPGSGGGASIALLSYQSSAVALEVCTLVAHNAGKGGAAGGGEAGQAGSLVAGNGVASGCSGGAAGSGSGGNGAQGGPGGLSLGIAYSGAAPTFDGAVVSSTSPLAAVTVGAKGSGGTGGSAGPAASAVVGQPEHGAAGVQGPDGVAQAVLVLP